MERIVVNALTGEQTVVPLTPEEIEAAAAAKAAEDAQKAWLASDQGKDEQAQRELDSMKALKAVALLCVDKGLFTLAELRAKYRGL